MRNIRQITALRDSYTESRATGAIYDGVTGEEIVDGANFQPIRNYYPRDVIEFNCFRPPMAGERATHIFDPTITPDPMSNPLGIRYRPVAGERPTHVNEWRFPMFPDYALRRRTYNSTAETDTATDDRFDADQEELGMREFTGRENLFEEHIRTALFDDQLDGGEVEPFWAFYRDCVQRVGWFIYPPINNIQAVDGVNEFLTTAPWYGRFISALEFEPEDPSTLTTSVGMVIEVSDTPYGVAQAGIRATSGRIEDVYPGGVG